MGPRIAIVPWMLILALACGLHAETLKPGKNQVAIRGVAQDVYFYPAAGTGPHAAILFAPGDGGWRGFALTIAQTLAAAGYDVYGLDTRRYLQSFTGDAALTTVDIASDFGQIANRVSQNRQERVILMGWSEGAGLGLVAAAAPANHDRLRGLVAIGTPQASLLAWHWKDVLAELRNTMPNEPTFNSSDFIANISPLPLFMIASAHDEYISVPTTQALFAAAREPKRLVVINGSDHKYGGKSEEFFRALREALHWVEQH